MRCLSSVILALCLCLLAASAFGAGGVAVSDVSASGGAAPAPASGSAALSSAAPAADAAEASALPSVPAPSFVPSPIPDTPPPGWTEEQLADLRKLELQLRHEDTFPPSPPGKPEMYYDITLTTQDLNESGKEQPLCVRRVRVKTDLGGTATSCEPDECLAYGFFFIRTRILAIPKEIRIQSATMDVAPYRNAPESAVLRDLDATSMLRAVPLPPVTLTMSGRPLPKMPADIPPPTKKNPWPSKYRVHLAAAFTDTKAPNWRCYSYSMMQLPWEAEGFSGMHIRTNIGDYKKMKRALGRYPILCAPEAVDHIDIQHSTFWKGSDMRKLKRMNGGPLLVDDGFVPLPFVTDKGPLPPPADGMYPPRSRRFSVTGPGD